jgi:flavodoxin
MKAIIIATSIVTVLLVALAGCRLFSRRRELATIAFAGIVPGKAAVVYYSQSKVQNTALVAKWIQKHVGGELVAIEPVEPYPEAYSQTLKVADKEHADGVEREIKPVSIPEDCEVVFIGSPIWYGTFAPPVATFLKGNPLSGRTVVPFCTHGGGGAGHFEQDVRVACPEAKVLPGFAARGSNQIERRLDSGVEAHHTENDVVAWLNGIFGGDGLGHLPQ